MNVISNVCNSSIKAENLCVKDWNLTHRGYSGKYLLFDKGYLTNRLGCSLITESLVLKQIIGGNAFCWKKDKYNMALLCQRL